MAVETTLKSTASACMQPNRAPGDQLQWQVRFELTLPRKCRQHVAQFGSLKWPTSNKAAVIIRFEWRPSGVEMLGQKFQHSVGSGSVSCELLKY